MFGLAFMFMIIGFMMAGAVNILPYSVYAMMPPEFRMMLLFVGVIVGVMGFILLWIRASKTGCIHLMKAGKPGTHIWFYVHRDGVMQITPSIRVGESQLYNKDLDSQVITARTYRLADHNICIVPEVVGHGVDIDYVLYVNLLESVYGLENLKEARRSTADDILRKFGIGRYKDEVSEENVAIGRDITETEKRALYERAVKAKQLRSHRGPATDAGAESGVC
jgi:hypothetical protein